MVPLGETPRILPAVHDVKVCSAIPVARIQLFRTRYEVGAVHEAGNTEPRTHNRPYPKLNSGGDGMGLVFHAILLEQNCLRVLANKWIRNCHQITMDHHEELGRGL